MQDLQYEKSQLETLQQEKANQLVNFKQEQNITKTR